MAKKLVLYMDLETNLSFRKVSQSFNSPDITHLLETIGKEKNVQLIHI